MEHFVIIVNGWKPLTVTTKSSFLDVPDPLVPDPLPSWMFQVLDPLLAFILKVLPLLIRESLSSRSSRLRQSVRIWSNYGPYFPAFGLNTKDASYLSVFSPYAGKCRPEELQIRTLFRQWIFLFLKLWQTDNIKNTVIFIVNFTKRNYIWKYFSIELVRI